MDNETVKREADAVAMARVLAALEQIAAEEQGKDGSLLVTKLRGRLLDKIIELEASPKLDGKFLTVGVRGTGDRYMIVGSSSLGGGVVSFQVDYGGAKVLRDYLTIYLGAPTAEELAAYG